MSYWNVPKESYWKYFLHIIQQLVFWKFNVMLLRFNHVDIDSVSSLTLTAVFKVLKILFWILWNSELYTRNYIVHFIYLFSYWWTMRLLSLLCHFILCYNNHILIYVSLCIWVRVSLEYIYEWNLISSKFNCKVVVPTSPSNGTVWTFLFLHIFI